MTTNISRPASGTERYHAKAWTRHVGEGGGTAYGVFDQTTGTFAVGDGGGFCSEFESLESAQAQAAKMNATDQMRQLIAGSTNSLLVDNFRIVVKMIAADPNDAAMPTYKLTRSWLVDELAKRNTQLEQALDAWAADPNSVESADDIVLRHAGHMDPTSTTHIAHPMDLDPFAGCDDDGDEFLANLNATVQTKREQPPIQPGKWYREHTVQQLVDEHTRRRIAVPVDAGDDVNVLADSLNADDRANEPTFPPADLDVLDSHIAATVRLTASNIERGELPIPAKIREHLADGRLVVQLVDQANPHRQPGVFDATDGDGMLTDVYWPDEFTHGARVDLSVARGSSHRIGVYFDLTAFPPAEPEPSISLAQFQQRVANGHWQPEFFVAPDGNGDDTLWRRNGDNHPFRVARKHILDVENELLWPAVVAHFTAAQVPNSEAR